MAYQPEILRLKKQIFQETNLIKKLKQTPLIKKKLLNRNIISQQKTLQGQSKFIPKQTDLNRIVKAIERKVSKGTHLLMTVREIQAGYLTNPS